MSMVSGFGSGPLPPKTNYVYLWRRQDTEQQNQEHPLEYFQTYYLRQSRSLGNPTVLQFWERRAPNNFDDPSDKILKILDMRPRSSRKHEMKRW